MWFLSKHFLNIFPLCCWLTVLLQVIYLHMWLINWGVDIMYYMLFCSLFVLYAVFNIENGLHKYKKKLRYEYVTCPRVHTSYIFYTYAVRWFKYLQYILGKRYKNAVWIKFLLVNPNECGLSSTMVWKHFIYYFSMLINSFHWLYGLYDGWFWWEKGFDGK